MESLKLLLWLVLSGVLAIWLIGWVFLIAEKISQQNQAKFSKWFKKLIEQSEKMFCLLVIVSTLPSCCPNTSVQIRSECPPMLREATYKAMQADEIADYRIAVEKCRVF